MVRGLAFLGWDVVEEAVQAPVVEPVDPCHRRVPDVIDSAQRATEERSRASHDVTRTRRL